MIRRALSWDERLTLVEWYLDWIDIRTFKQSGDRAARDRVIAYLAGNGQPKEAIAQSFNISLGTVTRVLNRLQKENGLAAEKSAARAKEPEQRKKGRDDTEVGGCGTQES